MTEMQEVPPMGGENLPLKELEKQEIISEVKPSYQQKKRRKFYLIAVLLIFLFFSIGIGLGFYLSQETKSLPKPSPSALLLPSPQITVSPSPSPSPSPGGMIGKLESFEKKLDETDLKEEKLIPPVLDFNIRFKLD